MSKRPEFVTVEDIERWDTNLEEDPNLPDEVVDNEVIREVCYAGLWLSEQLEELECPPEWVVRIQYTAGRLSYGRDPWEIHQDLLKSYKLNALQFEPDPANIN